MHGCIGVQFPEKYFKFLRQIRQVSQINKTLLAINVSNLYEGLVVPLFKDFSSLFSKAIHFN